MKLTENELREIFKLLEDGKPLPDEYRFKLFDDDREVELIWNGKTNKVESSILPFQVIEQIDEPRAEKDTNIQSSLFEYDDRGRQIGGWINKLIWGDNKYILSSLKNGPIRQEIEDNGGLKLIYIDPPFDVGADFSMDIEIGGEKIIKNPNILEEIAYRDTWGKGADSFIAMINERIKLMYDLLANDGSMYVHCDYRVGSFIKLILDDIFGTDNFKNEIVWHYRTGNIAAKQFQRKHDLIYFYQKSNDTSFNIQEFKEYYVQIYGPNKKISMGGANDAEDEYGRYRISQVDDVWNISAVFTLGSEHLPYPTQKPETLVERIIKASSNEGDLIADFFVGSGTTLAVAEKLGRKWIGADLGKFSIHTTRKRMIDIQRKLKNNNKSYRPFEIMNLGKYQRQHYVGTNQKLKEKEFIKLILDAYKAEEVQGFESLIGQKAGRLVAIGPLNMQLGRDYVETVIREAINKSISRVDVLAFEYEMGLSPHVQEEAKQKGVDLALKIIPPEVFDKRAVEKGQVKFYDVAYIEVKPHYENKSVAIELTDFSVFYNQDTDEGDLKSGQTKIIVRDGQVVKLHKDKESDIVEQKILTKEWTDWIDYWSVDYNYESKREVIPVFKSGVRLTIEGSTSVEDIKKENIVEKWTGGFIFENEWQDFRTKKKKELNLKTPFHKYTDSGEYKIAIKVVDIFGNDTTKVIEVKV